MVQWLKLRAPAAGSESSIPGWGTKIPHGQKKKKKVLIEHLLCAEWWRETHFVNTGLKASLRSIGH